MNNIKSSFQEFLIKQGYKITTPSGNPSTVYDYKKRIDFVCEIENITWEQLAENIDSIINLRVLSSLINISIFKLKS